MERIHAVVTTGIYCVPSCAGRPRQANLRLFATPVAAEAAGFRACHRCRPYRGSVASPPGSSALVCGAVDLIAAGVLDEGGEHALASRVGVSARHLRRMFAEQLGATPDQLARSRRAHFARRLLDDTDLPVSDVAFAAGFGSLRQFNRQMLATFRAPPRDLRGRRRCGDRLVADGGLALRVPLPGPVAIGPRLEQLAAAAIPGVEAVTAGRYRRTVLLGGDPGVIEITEADQDSVLLIAHLPRLEGLIHLVDRVRRIATGGGDDPYEDAVRSILTDSVGASGTPPVLGRIAARHGMPLPGLQAFGLSRLFPPPAALANADLRELGLGSATARAVRARATRGHQTLMEG